MLFCSNRKNCIKSAKSAIPQDDNLPFQDDIKRNWSPPGQLAGRAGRPGRAGPDGGQMASSVLCSTFPGVPR